MQNDIEYIIQTKNLGFGFNKNHKLLNNINLKVEKGSIYGFLGPNGAGKTTTIRLLLGLLKDKKKSVFLFGKNLLENKIEIFSKVGALIEQPSLYEHISGYDNLEITRRIKNINQKKVTEILKTVRLSDAAHKPVKTYSLGMKQRLGIAIALLGEPELLILDEPVNGLDPNGIVEIRELLKHINKEFGTTIFLSSHLLAEIEKIVTHIGIISMGELLFEGSIQQLKKLQPNELEVCIETDNYITAFHLLKTNYRVVECDGMLRIFVQSKKHVSEIIQILVNNNIEVYEAALKSKDLENFFLNMTENYSMR